MGDANQVVLRYCPAKTTQTEIRTLSAGRVNTLGWSCVVTWRCNEADSKTTAKMRRMDFRGVHTRF
jgi:hypothetical protein